MLISITPSAVEGAGRHQQVTDAKRGDLQYSPTGDILTFRTSSNPQTKATWTIAYTTFFVFYLFYLWELLPESTS